MTDKEVIIKVIDKVSTFTYKNGTNTLTVVNDNQIVVCGPTTKEKAIEWALECIGWNEDLQFFESTIYGFIFSRDFAEAFWIDEKPSEYPDRPSIPEYNYYWEKHLMLMIIEQNPIDYLRRFVLDTSEDPNSKN